MSEPDHRLQHYFEELKRRRVFRATAVYVAIAIAVGEVANNFFPHLGLPEWTIDFVVVLAVLGLPVTVALAWVFDIRPSEPLDGESRAATPERTPRDSSRPVPPAWHWTRRRTVIAGVIVTVLGVVVLASADVRIPGLEPPNALAAELEARDPVVVAEFEALSGDTSLARVITEGLRADLAQSSFLTVADRDLVGETLTRMMRPPGSTLDPATAREVAYRLGAKAVVEGEVGRVGNGYQLTARVVTPDSARALATLREAAADSTELLDAIERLSRELRDRAGESLGSVRASAPLIQVTTPSLAAFRKFAGALGAPRQRSIRLLEEAVDLDPGFAAAWALLTLHHLNNVELDEAFRALEQAREHQARLDPAWRRALDIGMATLTGDQWAAILAHKERAGLYPTQASPYNAMSDQAWYMGDWEAAIEYARRAIEMEPDNWVAHWNLVVALLDAGDVTAAWRAIEEATEALPPGHSTPRLLQILTLAQEARYDSAHQVDPTWPVASADRVRGRWAEATRHLRESSSSRTARWSQWLPVWDRFVVTGDTTAASALEASIDTVIATQGDFPAHAIAELAVALAMAGRSDGARRALAVYENRVPPEVRWLQEYLLRAIDGFLALDEGQSDQALSALRQARASTPWTVPVDAFIGHAYDLLGRPDSAIAAYTRYIETPWSYRAGFHYLLADPCLLVPVHERLAELYEEIGDRDAAARHAAAVVELWGDADPVLQPRVAAARRILAQASMEGR